MVPLPVNVHLDILVMVSHVTMLTNATLHHVTLMLLVTTTTEAILAHVTVVTKVTAKPVSISMSVLTHHVPKNHVVCAETMMVVTLVVVTMDMKVMDITAMMLMNAKTQMHALKMLHVAIPTVGSSVNAMLDILVTVTLHASISTNAKSLDPIIAVNTLRVAILQAVSSAHVLMDTLVMVPNAPNSMTEQFSTRVQTFGYVQMDMLVQCIAVKILMNALKTHVAREPHALIPVEASNANAEKASRVRHYLFSINYFLYIFYHFNPYPKLPAYPNNFSLPKPYQNCYPTKFLKNSNSERILCFITHKFSKLLELFLG